MKMTSMDIINKHFKKGMRGYDVDDVDDFMGKLSEDYETIYKENSIYKEKIFSLEEKLEHYTKLENTIQNTLLIAQNSAEQVKEIARKEAELIIRNANESAKSIIGKANDDVVRINDDYSNLKQDFQKFRKRYKNFMVTQLDMFDSMENDFMKIYNIGSSVESDIKPKEIDENSIFYKNESEKPIDAIEENMDSVKNFYVEE